MKSLNWQGILICKIKIYLLQYIFLNVSVEPCAFCLLVAGAETQELICNSKFASMASLPAARRQGNRWLDGIIGKKYITNFNVFK